MFKKNVKMRLKSVQNGNVEWINLPEEGVNLRAFVNTVSCFWLT
jgi:hypothetical protein